MRVIERFTQHLPEPLNSSKLTRCHYWVTKQRCKPRCMENDPNNASAPATKADLDAGFAKLEEKLDKKLDERLSERANVILEAGEEAG
jgi:hypothetical protein